MMRYFGRRYHFIYLSLSVLLCFGAAGVRAEADKHEEIPAFLQVAPGVYRGGQPSETGLKYLKSLGVKTIINFRAEEEAVREKRKTEQYGMKFVAIPWALDKPDPEVVTAFFRVLDDPSNRPLFFHCKGGGERTGVMAALYYFSNPLAGGEP